MRLGHVSEEWINPPPPRALQGDERFVGVDAKVRDFWTFATSNLSTNNVRGYLAEFLVAKAVGASGVRVEWDAFDVLTPEGIRVEVKSAGYLQAWSQRRLSRRPAARLRFRISLAIILHWNTSA